MGASEVALPPSFGRRNDKVLQSARNANILTGTTERTALKSGTLQDAISVSSDSDDSVRSLEGNQIPPALQNGKYKSRPLTVKKENLPSLKPHSAAKPSDMLRYSSSDTPESSTSINGSTQLFGSSGTSRTGKPVDVDAESKVPSGSEDSTTVAQKMGTARSQPSQTQKIRWLQSERDIILRVYDSMSTRYILFHRYLHLT